MRLAIAGGGTGGHIYPAVSAIEALGLLGRPTDVLWLGAAGRPEEAMAKERGWGFHPVQTAQVRGTGLRLPLHAAYAVGGAVGASRALKAFAADVLLATGGYVSVPGTLGARLAGVPVVLFLPDASPGWAIRFLRRFAHVKAASSDAAAAALGAGAVVTGYPVREAFATTERDTARAALGLSNRPAVLILGGSSGARRLNAATLRWAPQLLAEADVLHVAGRRDFEQVSQEAEAAGLSDAAGYHLYDYLEEMALAVAAADLVVSRAGAATLGELTVAARPSILVPGTFGGGHQRYNSDYMRRQGCSEVIEDDEVERALGPTVLELLGRPDCLADMAAKARAIARPDASRRLAQLLIETAEDRRRVH